MTDAAQMHPAQPWHRRPVLWVGAGAIVLAILAGFVLIENHNKRATLRYSDFLDQLNANNIASVTFSGTQINGTLKHPFGQATANGAAAPNDFHSLVPDVGDPALLPALRKEHVPIAVTSSSAYWWGTSAVVGGLVAILLAKPMLLIIAAAFVAGLVRVARGGKMELKSTLAMLPMFRSFGAEGDKPRQSPASPSPQADRPIVVEDKMADSARHRCTKAWYLRPPVWIAAIIVVALAVFGLVEVNKGPTAISYSDFLDQLDAGNVGTVTFAGTQIDGKFKRPIREKAANNAEPEATFRSQAPAFGDPSLLPELRQQHVFIDVVSSSSWLSWFGRLPWPMVLIIVALLIAGLVKLARGDKATTVSALQSHPMMAAVTGVFGKKEHEASGPSGGEQEMSESAGSRKAPPAA
jgi:ATP-dependent Zn protease